MADETYRIIYEGVPDKAIRGANALLAVLVKLGAEVDKLNPKLKALGVDPAGLVRYRAEATKARDALKGMGSDADKAEKSLKDVGKGNNSLGGYASRLEKVVADLNAAAQAGTSAGSALAGVGGGGGSGSGAGTGGGGGGGRGAGIGRAAAGLGRHIAYSAFRATARAVGQGAADRRQFFGQAANMSADFRKDLQELAVLQGKPSADDALVREQLGFAGATGLNAQDASELRLEYGGAIAPGKARGNIDDATAVGLEREAGRFGARYGIDPKTMGRMAGLLPNYAKVPSAAAGAGTLAASAEYLNIYGLGSVREMMPSMVGLQADMLDSEEGGRFKDLESLSARFGVTTFAAKSPAMAATQIRQANRLLRKFNGQSEEEFLRAQGITPEDDYESSLRKLAPAIKGDNADIVLAQAGFGNSTERSAVIKQAKMIEVVDKATKDGRIDQARAGAVPANAAYLESPTGRQQGAENREFAATIEAGMQGEALKAARADARGRMIAEGRLKSRGVAEALGDSVRGLLESGGGVSGEDINVDIEAVKQLKRDAAKVGVNFGNRYPGLDDSQGYFGLNSGSKINTTRGTDEAGFQKQFAGASAEVEAARKLRQAGALLIEGADAMGGGRQAPPAPGNGGAGVNPGRR